MGTIIREKGTLYTIWLFAGNFGKKLTRFLVENFFPICRITNTLQMAVHSRNPKLWLELSEVARMRSRSL